MQGEWPLVGRNAERYAREADLRFSLVRVNEHLDGISLASGETDELRRVQLHLGSVLAATRRLVLGLTNLTVGMTFSSLTCNGSGANPGILIQSTAGSLSDSS